MKPHPDPAPPGARAQWRNNFYDTYKQGLLRCLGTAAPGVFDTSCERLLTSVGNSSFPPRPQRVVEPNEAVGVGRWTTFKLSG